MTNTPPNATSEGDSGANDGSPLVCVTIIVSSVLIIGVLSILDATVMNVTIDTSAKTFDSSRSTIQWLISGYTLALASVIFISGWNAGHVSDQGVVFVTTLSSTRVPNLLGGRSALVVGAAQRCYRYCTYGVRCLADTAS